MIDVIMNGEGTIPPLATVLETEQHHLLNTLKSLGYAAGQLPLASLLSQLHGLTGNYAVVTPIRWQATHNDALVMQVGAELDLQEEPCWFASLSTFFAECGLSLIYHDTTTWLVNIDNCDSLASASPYALKNQSLMPHLNGLGPTLFWQKLLTEIQMFFTMKSFDKPTAVNGVWLYGTGEFQVNPEKIIYTDDSFLCERMPLQFKSLQTETKIIDNSIILINTVPASNHLEKLIAPYSTRWFWNNCAYAPKNKGWKQFLKGLIYAN